MKRALVAILVLAACGRAAQDRDPAPGPSNLPHEDPPAMTNPTLTWRPHPLTGFGLTVDVVDGVDVTEGDATDLHYLLQARGTSQVGVWVGASQSLASWRQRFSTLGSFGAESAITACGRPGARQEVSVATDRATGLVPTGDGGIGHLEHETPAQTHVAISGTTATGAPFVASWIVAADQRQALRADEDHFLASIRCP